MRSEKLEKPIKICFLSYTHPYDDTRVFHKEAFSLSQAGYQVIHLAPGSGECSQKLGINIDQPSKMIIVTANGSRDRALGIVNALPITI